MIIFRSKTYEDYFIDPETAVITDKLGNVVKQKVYFGRPCVHINRIVMLVHQIQAHTAWGYKKGYDVHHKDDNTLNNAISNLDYIEHKKHSSITNKDKKKENRSWRSKSARRIPRKKPIKYSKHSTPCSDDKRQKLREYNLGKSLTESAKNKLRLLHWFTNGKENIHAVNCPEGWWQGRTMNWLWNGRK